MNIKVGQRFQYPHTKVVVILNEIELDSDKGAPHIWVNLHLEMLSVPEGSSLKVHGKFEMSGTRLHEYLQDGELILL